ncbi:hypothetical protein [Chitinophaga arvensicola]|uniref:Major royal jelly protein n=1 Tax=Chitinophaga arvensicola TaxID=29529 RepID=A0A1I0SBB0_9BACT|nr:hypothetical protein [Chitinophaga arvensicola]SEW53975.1 hypothetical protein SAMN04488122_5814 [Chitinophaga arvensicola]
MMKSVYSCLLFSGFAAFTIACGKDNGSPVTPPPADTTIVVVDTVKTAGYDLSLLDRCTLFNETPVVTPTQKQDYRELSGVAPSRVYAGLLYVHEDSGNYNEVYVTDTKGQDMGKLVLDGIGNRDWEDIATGPGPENGKNYIYVAEIGDNKAANPSVFIYRFPEPDLSAANAATVIHITAVDKIELVYPKGAVNAESLLLDPLTRDLYIATKEQARSTLYVARYPQSTSKVTTLVALDKLPFDLLTAGDISGDGSEIIVRNTGQIWYWKRNAGETIAAAMLRKPQDAPYARNERQGEGVCFAADGSGYITDSEVKDYPTEKVALSFYKRK